MSRHRQSRPESEDRMRHINRDELVELAATAGFTLAEAEVDQFLLLSENMFQGLDRVERLADPPASRVVDAIRDPGRKARSEEDPLNAITRWCTARAKSPEGPLAGV